MAPSRHRSTVPAASAVETRRDIYEVGDVVGRVYEILRVLGEGGMGQVYEAQDHSLNRRVAIKANWPDLDAPPLRDEARALAAFRHQSLVTVHGIGVHRGVDYIVMERIYGVSLADLLSQRLAAGQPMTVKEVVTVLASAAEGLNLVHQAGIAHRDIKPGNIMLTPDHRVVLMDFGLVLPEFDMATQEFIAGSPPYMSPESLTNLLEKGSGPLVDIYAFGVTAYELLTGELPRDAPQLEELYKLTLQAPPDVRDKRPDVPGPLAELIQEMMATAAGERPQNAEEVAWRLKSIARKAPETRPGPVQVLVVDDDPDIAKLLGFYAKRSLPSAEVRTAKDGEEALARVRERAPDVMLLDLHMPRMNGIEVCMHMRGEGLAEGCAIVAVSAGAQEHDRALLQQLGIKHFVEKGSQLGERLAALLEQLVKSRRAPPSLWARSGPRTP